MIQTAITASATLLAMVVGGWITIRAQDRLWRRDHDRQWRDIRLNRYGDFVSAFRDYIAYVQQPDATVTAVQRPVPPHDMMPVLGDAGLSYTQRFDTAKTAMRLVTSSPQVIETSRAMVHCARDLAALRATTDPAYLPAGLYKRLWETERAFMNAARVELGLSTLMDRSWPDPLAPSTWSQST